MDTKQLLARMAEQRATWADVGPGLRVKLLRPPEVELPLLAGGVFREHAVKYAVDWQGFTEATLLGGAVGSSDAVPFDRELWDAYTADHADAAKAAVRRLAEAVTAYLETRDTTEKN